MDEQQPNTLAQVKDDLTQRYRGLRARHSSVRHVAQAWGRMQDNNANQYAAAITYFSFLALFPLILLAVAVTGFVLHSHPEAQASLFRNITEQIPGSFGQTLNESIQTAIDARTSVGIVGLVGVLLTGLGWIGNLRSAIDAMWGRRPAKRNFIVTKAMNLLVLAGLGLGILISLGLTVVGTALTDQILRALSLEDVFGVHYLVRVFGLLLALVGDFIIFSWLLVRLPGADVPARVAVKGALLAAIGFEALKLLGTFTIAKSAGSPTAGPFAGLLAVLIWIQLVCRFMLFCAAWMAELTSEQATAAELAVDADAAAGPASGEDRGRASVREPMNPAALGATLVGAGAVVGAAAATAWRTAASRRGRSGRLTVGR